MHLCEQEATRLAESQRKEAACADKTQKEQERQKKREDMKLNPTFVFTGTLKSQKKPGLQDIAYVIGLATEGSVAKLLESITCYFDANPARKTEPKYAALFSSSRKRALPTELEEENIEPSPHRP